MQYIDLKKIYDKLRSIIEKKKNSTVRKLASEFPVFKNDRLSLPAPLERMWEPFTQNLLLWIALNIHRTRVKGLMRSASWLSFRVLRSCSFLVQHAFDTLALFFSACPVKWFVHLTQGGFCGSKLLDKLIYWNILEMLMILIFSSLYFHS